MTQVIYDINLLTKAEANELLVPKNEIAPSDYEEIVTDPFGTDGGVIEHAMTQALAETIKLARKHNAMVFMDPDAEPLLSTTWKGYKPNHWIHKTVKVVDERNSDGSFCKITDTSNHTLTNTYCMTIEYAIGGHSALYMNIVVVW